MLQYIGLSLVMKLNAVISIISYGQLTSKMLEHNTVVTLGLPVHIMSGKLLLMP